jgi:2',3'-cyclic-nucleotide 2'-phosphodiesterase (5'-nucleotidase family)
MPAMVRGLLPFLAAAVLARPAAPAGAEALLVVTGDQHSAYDRTARVVAMVDELKAAHPGLPLAVLLNGDTQEYGNVLARRSGAEIDFAMYAALARRAPTVLNIGNHEPEFYALAETVQRIEATGVRVVTNITDRTTGRPFAPSSARLPLGREEAVVVGVTTDALNTYRVAVRPSLALADPAAWAAANFPALLARAPLPIVLSHAGIAADRAMLGLVPDGTLFAGAHDHQRFVQPFGRTVYFHSGSWNQWLSLAWLCRDEAGRPAWHIEQLPVDPAGPADPELAAMIARVRAQHLTAEDTVVVGRTPAAMATDEAGRFAARALCAAAQADAAFIGNTTFGAGLPAGAVSRLDFDACVRFDGGIWTAEVDGARLQALLAAANQGPDTPFALRQGGFFYAAGPAHVDPARRYRIATNDWSARDSARQFGLPAISWTEVPGLRLKSIVQAALNRASD